MTVVYNVMGSYWGGYWTGGYTLLMETALLLLGFALSAGGAPLSSGLQILKEMPEQLRPHPVSGWDKADESERQAWFKTAAAGERWESTCKVVNWRVERSNGFYAGGVAPKAWSVVAVFEPVKYMFAGTRITELRDVRVWYDEDPSDKWKGVRPGHVMKVSGRVRGTKFSGSARSGSFSVFVDDLSVTGESLK